VESGKQKVESRKWKAESRKWKEKALKTEAKKVKAKDKNEKMPKCIWSLNGFVFTAYCPMPIDSLQLKSIDRRIQMKKTVFIKGMTCGHCKKRVENALLEINGVENVLVDLDAGKAEMRISREVGDSEFRFAVEEAGYEVTEIV